MPRKHDDDPTGRNNPLRPPHVEPHMNRRTINRLRRIETITTTINTRIARSNPHIIATRLDAWADHHYPTGNDDPHVAGGTPTSPTETKALNQPDITYNGRTPRQIITDYEHAAQRLELLLRDLTRPTTATEQEHATTRRHTPDEQTGAGTCDACGKYMPGGEPKNRIRHYQARPLCPRDHRQVHRDLARGIPLDKSIATIRTYRWRGPTD